MSFSIDLDYGMVDEITKQQFRKLSLSAAIISVKVPSKDFNGFHPQNVTLPHPPHP